MQTQLSKGCRWHPEGVMCGCTISSLCYEIGIANGIEQWWQASPSTLGDKGFSCLSGTAVSKCSYLALHCPHGASRKQGYATLKRSG